MYDADACLALVWRLVCKARAQNQSDSVISSNLSSYQMKRPVEYQGAHSLNIGIGKSSGDSRMKSHTLALVSTSRGSLRLNVEIDVY